jgi:actin-related protein
MQEEENNPLVFDFGTYLSKVGHSGDNDVTAYFPTVVGIGGLNVEFHEDYMKDRYYVGDAAYSKKGYMTHFFPMEKGIIKNFELMEGVFQHSFTMN